MIQLWVGKSNDSGEKKSPLTKLLQLDKESHSAEFMLSALLHNPQNIMIAIIIPMLLYPRISIIDNDYTWNENLIGFIIKSCQCHYFFLNLIPKPVNKPPNTPHLPAPDKLLIEEYVLLTLMGTLAQNEVESTSKNVKMGIKMKMKRGELMGFNGCLGYDYHPEDKTITVNEAEAETVRLIFELYLQGYGTYTIAKQLEALGKLNKKGVVKWTDSGVRGIIKNEKYKGDLLLQKTITTDPISKRRIENFGEEEQYYVRDHHEPIVSREVWEQAKEIRLSRNRQTDKKADGKREKYTKKYALSSMCECGFCGTKLTRRTLHSSSKYETPVWYCRNAANKGKANCPNSKSVHESILENAFLEAYKLLAGNFDDVIDSVVGVIEDISTNNEDIGRLKKGQKALENLEQRRKKLTDLYLDEGISKEAYDEKYEELSVKIQKSKENIEILQTNVSNQKDVGKRMASLKKALSDGNILEEFDRVVFESIVEKVIVGEANDDGTVDPFKLTFVMKGSGNSVVPNAKEWFKAEKSTIQSA